MALRALEGIRVTPESLAEEIIASVGPGGNFLTQRHTVRSIRSDEYSMPMTADRRGRQAWESAGALDTRERAKQIAREILARPRRSFLPAETERALRAQFDLGEWITGGR
jgi:trimethylamine--corrinoid protein Co-methyltransferase